MSDWIIVWTGDRRGSSRGELLPPRASGAWPFSGHGDREPVRAGVTYWKEEGFRRRVRALTREGHSRRVVARLLGVPISQVQAAIHHARRTR